MHAERVDIRLAHVLSRCATVAFLIPSLSHELRRLVAHRQVIKVLKARHIALTLLRRLVSGYQLSFFTIFFICVLEVFLVFIILIVEVILLEK
jgi:hypothetical protein